jgi:hypothetical protein
MMLSFQCSGDEEILFIIYYYYARRLVRVDINVCPTLSLKATP